MCETLTFQNSSFKIHQVVVDGEPWFRGKDIAKVLGYQNTTKAIIVHVDDDDVESTFSEDRVVGRDEEEAWHDLSTKQKPEVLAQEV